MLNEFVYCPRLFYLEWVQAQFAQSADTVEGSRIHRRVDREATTDDPASVQDFTTWSLDLACPKLGVVGKADIVDVSGNEATPVDYKKGTPPDNEHRAWDPERVQLCLQGLMLRELGYRSDHGVLWFARARQRVEVPFTSELIDPTETTIARARAAAASPTAPPPLVDSPKCGRCSLVGICLPDETNMLAERTHEQPRRLVPGKSDARPLYVTEPGAVVGRSKGRITVRSKDHGESTEVRAIDVSQLSVFGNSQVTTQLVRSLLREGTPIAWFSHGGWFSGVAMQPTMSQVQLRARQYGIASSADCSIAGEMIRSKIMNCRTLLRRNAETRPDRAITQLKRLASKSVEVESKASLLGVEGTAARIYFSHFAQMVRSEGLPGEAFGFEGRNRRPPRDAVDCLLSFVYALLIKDVTAALHLVGFDPAMGLFHRPRFGRPALSLDLAEEFRPLIGDSTVLRLINNREVQADDFIFRISGVALSPKARRAVIAAYERRMEQEIVHPMFGYTVSYRRIIEVQARLLAACLLGDIPCYSGFVTR